MSRYLIRWFSGWVVIIAIQHSFTIQQKEAHHLQHHKLTMGKGGDANSVTSEEEKKEVLINGQLYDVTNLKHPGGSIIDFYAGKGIDATQAFENFHIRSAGATKYLKSLPSRPVDKKATESNLLPGQKELLEDFNQLQKDLIAEGYFKPSLPHVVMRVVEILVFYAAGIWWVRNSNFIPGVLALSIAQGRCGWLMHEGGHYSLTGIIKLDRVLQILIYGVGCGMSGSWWRIQHNKHHSMPQKLGYDVDLNTLPLIAFTEKVVKRVGASFKYWLSLQAYCFPLITNLLVAIGWQFYLHPRHIIRRKHVLEGLSLILRYVLWTVLITFQIGLLKSTLLFLAFNWISANYIFINFAVSHTHLPTVDKEDTQVDWVRYSAIHTMNVHPGPFKFISWWMSYLNFQIEHHLFPSMPQFRHPLISARVKKFLEKHGLKYDQRSYIESLKVTFKNLDKVGAEIYYG